MNSLIKDPIISSSQLIKHYQTIINLANQIHNYNFRNFFIRKANYDMKHNISTSVKTLKECNDEIESMKRIVIVQNLYNKQLNIDGLKYSEYSI